MRDEIAEFFTDKVYYGGLTYNAHPISLAAAIANINVIKDDQLVENA
jgi:taurine--2-oxoglutarate transaminase